MTVLHSVRVHPSKDNLPREEQLAWKMAEVAADPVEVTPEVRGELPTGTFELVVGDFGQHSSSRSPRLPDTPLRLLFVGQVAPHKGVHLLLEALAAMGRHAEHFETRIVGSSELRDAEDLSDYERGLRSIAASLRGPIAIEPYRLQEGVGELYRWADVVAVPSRAEPFGMVPLEAMASGALVLANRSGALPEVLGSAGRLVEPTVAGWVRELTTLTPAAVEAARGTATAHGRSFTWERSHTALLDGLERLGAAR